VNIEYFVAYMGSGHYSARFCRPYLRCFNANYWVKRSQ